MLIAAGLLGAKIGSFGSFQINAQYGCRLPSGRIYALGQQVVLQGNQNGEGD